MELATGAMIRAGRAGWVIPLAGWLCLAGCTTPQVMQLSDGPAAASSDPAPSVRDPAAQGRKSSVIRHVGHREDDLPTPPKLQPADWETLDLQPVVGQEVEDPPAPPAPLEAVPPPPTFLDADEPAPEPIQQGRESAAIKPHGPAQIEHRPIDLATSLRLAGAGNPHIALAAERVREAQARWREAKVMWLPSLAGGVSWTKHDGRIQETQGDVLEVSRNAYFVGGGAVVDQAPLTGAAGGPARFFIDLSLADALFEPLAARQTVRASAANRSATFNDVLFEVAVAYEELVRAQALVGITDEAVANIEELVSLTTSLARAGAALDADVERARAELARRRRMSLEAQGQVGVVSAELARLLSMDPAVMLYAHEAEPLPLDLISCDAPVRRLIARAVAGRPEMGQSRALVGEANARLRQEHWRPWLPNVNVGASFGGFGGGQGSQFRNFSDRSDVDLLAVWQVRNLGIGEVAARGQATSRRRQAMLDVGRTRDLVASEVAAAWHLVQARFAQLGVARERITAAEESLRLNFIGIRGGGLRAIEAQQAVMALDSARREYLDAVIRYNQAQFQLLRAIGVPPSRPIGRSPGAGHAVKAPAENKTAKRP